MMDTYRAAVLSYYEKRKALGELSTNLMKPTCANLRNEFRLKFDAGCNESDLRIIKEFLKLPFDDHLSNIVVKKCETDQFKALGNFLNRHIKTHERNIELLAWLINFPKRPSYKYLNLEKNKWNLLSEISINESGFITESNNAVSNYQVNSSLQKQVYSSEDSGLTQVSDMKEELGIAEGKHNIHSKHLMQTKVTLEYPSGVKLSVDASDLTLIAKLIQLRC